MERAKILIADDEAHIIHVVQLKLQNGGFDVVTAMDGREALELARRERPQLLISDLQMPILSGLELAAALYQDPQTRHLPIILLTAKGFEVDDEATARTNVRMIMTKPFSPRELLARVNELVEQPAGVC
ncbi:MAG TPA: response regulator [Phycisphaerae bacterium]|nr:response regulator [Phycisphaerae bacterium]HOI55563.1 response regulator [Phycisphaerae bacterium]